MLSRLFIWNEDSRPHNLTIWVECDVEVERTHPLHLNLKSLKVPPPLKSVPFTNYVVCSTLATRELHARDIFFSGHTSAP